MTGGTALFDVVSKVSSSFPLGRLAVCVAVNEASLAYLSRIESPVAAP